LKLIACFVLKMLERLVTTTTTTKPKRNCKKENKPRNK
jgi:hypothetical protein